MQKVSKQSLAMIALSILLAISIALTFTFAALSDQKTATGTITFSGDVSIEMGAGFTAVEGNANSYKFALTANKNGVEFANNLTISLGDTSQDAYVMIKISELSATGETNNVTAGAISMSKADATLFTGTSYSKLVSTSKFVATGESKTTVKLADLIKFTVDLNKLVNGDIVTFTITIDANVNSSELN